jgi:hypothetical protein
MGNINSVKVHPQLSNNRHRVGGMLLGTGSLWPIFQTLHLCKEMGCKEMGTLTNLGLGGSQKYNKKNWPVL